MIFLYLSGFNRCFQPFTVAGSEVQSRYICQISCRGYIGGLVRKTKIIGFEMVTLIFVMKQSSGLSAFAGHLAGVRLVKTPSAAVTSVMAVTALAQNNAGATYFDGPTAAFAWLASAHCAKKPPPKPHLFKNVVTIVLSCSRTFNGASRPASSWLLRSTLTA